MRFAFGVPIGLMWALSVGSSASVAASCPPRANKPSNWCVQSKGKPQSHQPGSGAQQPQQPRGTHHGHVPGVPPNPYQNGSGSLGKMTPDLSIPAVPPPPAGSIDPRPVPTQRRTSIPNPGSPGQPRQNRSSPDQPVPASSIPVQYVIVCRVDNERYCPIASDSPVAPGTVCTCEEEGLQGWTE